MMTPSDDSWRIGVLQEADIDNYKSIASESLHVSGDEVWDNFIQRIGLENFHGIYSHDQLVGAVALYRMGQWFGGNRLDCAGVSGVAVATHFRGTGACRRLLNDMLRELYREKTPLASLYASTQRLYRTVGFEQSGELIRYSIPISALNTGDRVLPVHRYTESSPELLAALNYANERRGKKANGLLDRTDGLWARLFAPHGGVGTTTYLIGDCDQPDGYAILKKSTRAGGFPQALVATDCCANTPAAMNRMIALIYDHRSVCDRFEFSARHNDLLVLMASEQGVEVPKFERWLNRIVHLPSALEQRGYPKDLTCELHFEIEDATLPENAGSWILKIDGGRGSVQQGGSGAIKTDVRALAPLFASYYSATDLVDSGRLETADLQHVLLADRVFAGPSPWMVELF